MFACISSPGAGVGDGKIVAVGVGVIGTNTGAVSPGGTVVMAVCSKVMNLYKPKVIAAVNTAATG